MTLAVTAHLSLSLRFQPVHLEGTDDRYIPGPGPKESLNETFFVFFLRFYLFIFRQRGRKGERERNISV